LIYGKQFGSSGGDFKNEIVVDKDNDAGLERRHQDDDETTRQRIIIASNNKGQWTKSFV